MDWDTNHITRLTALEFYEKDAMWRMKKATDTQLSADAHMGATSKAPTSTRRV